LVLLALGLARAAGTLTGSLLPEPGPGLWLVILLAGLAVVVQLPAERWSGRRALGLASPLLLVLALLAAAAAEVWGVPNASEAVAEAAPVALPPPPAPPSAPAASSATPSAAAPSTTAPLAGAVPVDPAVAQLRALGLTIKPLAGGGFGAGPNAAFSNQNFAQAAALLAGLPGLRRLDLSRTPVIDLAPIGGLTGLRELSIQKTAVVDLAPIRGLTGLTLFNMRDTVISDIRPIAGMTALEILDLRSTRVTDLARWRD
jgi:Leucine-rich repeat (LRR) protein